MSDAGNPPTPTPAPNWFDELDEVHRGHVVSRGLDKLDAGAAARQAVKDHREAQAAISRVHGIPADQVLRVPKDAADPGWGDVWKRLGRPEKPDDYKIEGVKFADGKDPTPEFVGHMRALAHDLNLPADKAGALAQRVMALADSNAVDDARAGDTRRSANDAELHRAWGANHDYFRFQTTRAAQILGIPEGVVKTMEGQSGEEYVAFMESLRGLAGKMGEAELLRGETGGGGRALSRDEAVARRDDLMKDNAFVTRLLSNEAGARKEFEDLAKIIVGPAQQGAPQRR